MTNQVFFVIEGLMVIIHKQASKQLLEQLKILNRIINM